MIKRYFKENRKKVINSILGILLSISMTMTQIIYIQAKDIDESTYSSDFGYGVNTLFANEISDDDYFVNNSELSTYAVTNYEVSSDREFASQLRQCMVRRETSFEITHNNYNYSGIFETYVKLMLKNAYEYSSSSQPNEGDYIQYNFKRYTFNVEFISNKAYFKITMEYRDSASQEEQVTNEVERLINSWNMTGLSEYEKYKKIHDYVAKTVTYDSSLSKFTAYNALIEKTAVCQGYALLIYRLCQEAGVECRIISGDAGGRHAWNIVKIGDKYYNTDVTWDSDNSTADNISYKYFLISDSDFINHNSDPEYITEEFINAHPKYETSYFITVDKINASHSGYTFKTISNSVFSDATGTNTILIFGDSSDKNYVNEIKMINDSNMLTMENVRVAAIDIKKTGIRSVSSFAATYTNGIKFCYDTTNTAVNMLFNLAAKAGLIDEGESNISVPVTLVIDSNNKIQYAYTGGGITSGQLIYNTNILNGAPEATIPPLSTNRPTPTNRPISSSQPTAAATSQPGRTPEPTAPATTQSPIEATSQPEGTPEPTAPATTQSPIEATSQPGLTPEPTVPAITQSPIESTSQPGGNIKPTAPATIQPTSTIAPVKLSATATPVSDKTFTDNPRIIKGKKYKVGDLKYKVISNKVGNSKVECVSVVVKTKKSINVPSKIVINGVTCKVVSIGNNAFKALKKLQSVTIGKNIVSIKKGAFYKCTKLNRITIYSKVLKTIGKNAFKKINNEYKFKYYKNIKKLLKKVGI